MILPNLLVLGHRIVIKVRGLEPADLLLRRRLHGSRWVTSKKYSSLEDPGLSQRASARSGCAFFFSLLFSYVYF